MFYKLLGAGVVVMFGGVFWLAGPSATPAAPAAAPASSEPPGHRIALPVADVYAAIADMKQGEFKTPSEVASIRGGADMIPSVRLEREYDKSIRWVGKEAGKRLIDMTVRLRPSPDGAGTLVNLDYVRHPLPDRADTALLERTQKVMFLRFGQMLSDELKPIDPEFAAKVRKDAHRPLMAEGYAVAVSVAANPVAVMKQANKIERDMRTIETDIERGIADRIRKMPPPPTPGVNFRPGQPMVDPSRPVQ